MKILDLCCGTKSASYLFLAEYWQVTTLDSDPRFEPDIVADVRNWQPDKHYDFIWASPPCTEFSREFMPWCKTGVAPDMSIVLACKWIIDQVKPRYWCIENVKGAAHLFAPVLGFPREIVGPFFLWGFFPPLGKVRLKMRDKESRSSSASIERGMIPPELSGAMLRAITRQSTLWEVS